MGVEIALMSILALGGAGIYLGLKTLENYSPGRRKIQRDLKKLKAELEAMKVELVPINREEMEQLSFNSANKKSKKGVVKTIKGVFTTVYHEPLVAWIYRRYVSSKENTLVYVKTTELELVYRTKKQMTEVLVNNQMVGSITEDGALMVRGKSAPVAQINQIKGAVYFPIIMGRREIGGLTNPEKSEQVNPRAFQLIAALDKQEEILFLILAFHAMVRLSI